MFLCGATALAGCSGIEPGPEPKFYRGEAVVERLSGRVGLVQDGHFDPFVRGWKYRVRFEASSLTNTYCYPSAVAYGDASGGAIWVASYELRKADAPASATDIRRAPIGDSPASTAR